MFLFSFCVHLQCQLVPTVPLALSLVSAHSLCCRKRHWIHKCISNWIDVRPSISNDGWNARWLGIAVDGKSDRGWRLSFPLSAMGSKEVTLRITVRWQVGKSSHLSGKEVLQLPIAVWQTTTNLETENGNHSIWPCFCGSRIQARFGKIQAGSFTQLCSAADLARLVDPRKLHW